MSAIEIEFATASEPLETNLTPAGRHAATLAKLGMYGNALRFGFAIPSAGEIGRFFDFDQRPSGENLNEADQRVQQKFDAALRATLGAVGHRSRTEAGKQAIDPDNLIGAAVWVTVTHTEFEGTTYANVTRVEPRTVTTG